MLEEVRVRDTAISVPRELLEECRTYLNWREHHTDTFFVPLESCTPKLLNSLAIVFTEGVESLEPRNKVDELFELVDFLDCQVVYQKLTSLVLDDYFSPECLERMLAMIPVQKNQLRLLEERDSAQRAELVGAHPYLRQVPGYVDAIQKLIYSEYLLTRKLPEQSYTLPEIDTPGFQRKIKLASVVFRSSVAMIKMTDGSKLSYSDGVIRNEKRVELPHLPVDPIKTIIAMFGSPNIHTLTEETVDEFLDSHQHLFPEIGNHRHLSPKTGSFLFQLEEKHSNSRADEDGSRSPPDTRDRRWP